jgi:aminoglycoside phosphotransferase (APT) family kinase protein
LISGADPADAERPLVDVEALSGYLDAKLPGEGPFDVERHRAGHSNETFFVRRSGQEWVLRRPPRGAFLPTAHDVLREHRVLSAVAGTPVRAPRPILACDDESVIGVAFYVMEKVDGSVPRTALPADLDTEEERRRIGQDLIDAMAELHAVDWRAAGLEGWGRSTGYLERQVRRWSGQLALATQLTRPLPDLVRTADWLAERLPESPPSTIVHGDYKLDNVMLGPAPPARVAAILDWEMSTIGDPLADLGYLLSFWREPGDPEDAVLAEQIELTRAPGFPSRAEMVARYRERAGRGPGDLTWYVVLAFWKLAILLEGSYARHLAGATDDPFFTELEAGVPALARRALDVAARGAGV